MSLAHCGSLTTRRARTGGDPTTVLVTSVPLLSLLALAAQKGWRGYMVQLSTRCLSSRRRPRPQTQAPPLGVRAPGSAATRRTAPRARPVGGAATGKVPSVGGAGSVLPPPPRRRSRDAFHSRPPAPGNPCRGVDRCGAGEEAFPA